MGNYSRPSPKKKSDLDKRQSHLTSTCGLCNIRDYAILEKKKNPDVLDVPEKSSRRILTMQTM